MRQAVAKVLKIALRNVDEIKAQDVAFVPAEGLATNGTWSLGMI
jgi:hypothetical protein